MRKFMINNISMVAIAFVGSVLGVIAAALFMNPTVSVFLNTALFAICCRILAVRLIGYIRNKRAEMFVEGDQVAVITGDAIEYGEFERPIMAPEPWMPSELVSLLEIEVASKHAPMLVIKRKGGLSIASTDKVFLFEEE